MNTVIGRIFSPESMFSAIGGWTTQFEINGKVVGGNVPILTHDPRLIWHMEVIGGVLNKRILELGSLEGAHAKMMVEAGADSVISIEGLSDCWIRCLIVKEAFNLNNIKFLFGDFCEYVEKYEGDKFDIISAAGVLYHQLNPAKLIHNMYKVSDTVLVWSQVASRMTSSPSDNTGYVECNGSLYGGKWNNYMGTRLTSESYCGGLNNEAFWMYEDEMIRCFKDAGFVNIISKDSPNNINGESVLFVASKNNL